MAEREVVIKVSAKNLTEAEFAKVKKGLGGLGTASEGAAKKTSALQRGFSSFGKVAPGALRLVTVAAAATAGAIVGVALAVVKLGQRGSKLAAIQDSFRRLTAVTGESGKAMIAVTRTATKGLITDLDIMAAANKGLLLGLPITSGSMGDLSKTAIVLGKAMGLGATKSLDDLITALGRSSPMILDNLGLTVKVGDANKTYAAKLGKTVSQLTEAEKKTAFYEAALEAARVKVEALGGIQLTFGDRLQRTSNIFTNFLDRLSIGIAKSPIFATALDTVQMAMEGAFGGDQKEKIIGIVETIERATLNAVVLGEAAVGTAIIFTRGFAIIKTVVLSAALAVVKLAARYDDLVASGTEMAANLPGVGSALKDQAIAARQAADASASLEFNMRQQVDAATLAVLGGDALGMSLATLRAGFTETKTAIELARTSQQELNVATGDGTTKTTNLGTALGGVKSNIEALTPAFETWKEELVDTSDVNSLFVGDITLGFGEMSIAGDFWAINMEAVGARIAAMNARVAEAARRQGITTREESKKTEEQIVKDLETLLQKYGEYSDEVIALQKKLDDFRRKSTEETNTGLTDSQQRLTDDVLSIAQRANEGFKGMAIQAVKIACQKAIALALSSLPWPFSLVAAAGAAAACAIVLSRLQSTPAFAEGTHNLDFQEFGPGTQSVLHGREAVIPQGGGHMLAEEIANAMARGRGPENPMAGELREFMGELRGEFRDLSRSIQRSVRDGVLLAK